MSDCACMYSSSTGMDPDFCVERWVVARKTHRCFECGGVIAARERYHRTHGKWDGDMKVYKTCAFCQTLRSTFYCEEWVYGGLWGDIHESLFPRFDSACLAKLDDPVHKQRLASLWWAWVPWCSNGWMTR